MCILGLGRGEKYQKLLDPNIVWISIHMKCIYFNNRYNSSVNFLTTIISFCSNKYMKVKINAFDRIDVDTSNEITCINY